MNRVAILGLLGAFVLAIPVAGQQQKSLSVVAQPSDVLEKAAGVGERYAVLIGITKYQNASINLAFAAADAESMNKLLLDPEIGGYKPENVRLLVNEQATRKNIMSALGAWLAGRVKPEDSVIIFYSGHGALGANTDAYWVTYDADIDDLYSSALGNKEISGLIANLKAKRKLTLIDSCFSEATAKTYKALVPSDVFREFDGRGAVTMTASTGQEKSVELNGHGAFTYHLLDALSGKADVNANGVVELDEVWNYLSDRVQKTAAEGGNRQRPVLLADRLEHGFPLTINPARAGGATLAELKKLYTAGTITVDEVGEAERLFEQREGTPELRQLYRDLAAGVLTPEYFRKMRQMQGLAPAPGTTVNAGSRQIESDPAVAYAQAETQNSEAGWDAFVKTYPTSPQAALAQGKLDALRKATRERAEALEATAAYVLADSQNSEASWGGFIKQYPASALANVAQSRLDALRLANRERETALYSKAVGSDAVGDWDRLLVEFPAGRFVEEAVKKKALSERRVEEEGMLKAVRTRDTTEAWNEYLVKYPNGVGVTEARERIDQLGYLEMADLVSIPAGTFMMGSSQGDGDAKPEHRVEVDAFRMGRGEVTNRLLLKFLDETKRPRPAEPNFAKNYMSSNPDLPAVNVKYTDAIAFCEWLSQKTGAKVRLPTEAEWEYAARGGRDGNPYPWGTGDPKVRARFKDNANSGMKVVAIDAFPANDFGLRNIVGNVAEWVADYYDENVYRGGNQRNPAGPSTGKERVIRGGSFDGGDDMLRVFVRDKAEPIHAESWLGFRIVVK